MAYSAESERLGGAWHRYWSSDRKALEQEKHKALDIKSKPLEERT